MRYKIIILIWLVSLYVKIKDSKILKPLKWVVYYLTPYLYKRWVNRYTTKTHYFTFICRKA